MSPLSSDDLRALADAMEQIAPALVTGDDYTSLGALVLRVEVTRPDSDDVIGHFTIQDGWVGFLPLGHGRP